MDEAALVAIQATLAMRPVKPSIQPATTVQPAALAICNSLAALVRLLLRILYSSRMPSLFGESSKVSFLEVP